jgi:hypothetical protein
MSAPEPYLAPIPDERLQTWKPEARLVETLSPDDTTLVLQNDSAVAGVLRRASDKIIRIDNEFIELKDVRVDGDVILAGRCRRGAFHTLPAAHREQSSVKLMYLSGYHNFYPGTLEMSNGFAERLSRILIEGDLENFVVDGLESCLETGYGNYTGNIFLQKFYDQCVAKNKEVLITGSGYSQYGWHFMSHMSWGEGDQKRGVRGTMLDYRFSRRTGNSLESHVSSLRGKSEIMVSDIRPAFSVCHPPAGKRFLRRKKLPRLRQRENPRYFPCPATRTLPLHPSPA